jgi:hypothetical protein
LSGYSHQLSSPESEDEVVLRGDWRRGRESESESEGDCCSEEEMLSGDGGGVFGFESVAGM